MSKRPLKHMNLRQKIVSEKDFLRKVNRSRTARATKRVIAEASPEQVRLLQNVVIAHFDPKQSVPIDKHSFKRLRLSKKLKFIRKSFSPTKTLNCLKEAHALLLKIVSVIKIFTRNVLAS